MVLLDANTLVYYLDETANYHNLVIARLQELVDDQEQLAVTHHIIEEVLFVLSKLLPGADLTAAVTRIGKLPGLVLVEPAPSIDFAKRYAALSQKMKLGLNDALILQLMLDAGITRLFSYDKKLVRQASTLSIEQVS